MAALVPALISPSAAPVPPTLPLGPGAGGTAARGKKRPASPGSGSCGKKKRLATPGGSSGSSSQSTSADTANEIKMLNMDSSTGAVENPVKPLPFKAPTFIHSGIGGAAAGKKNRTWKNLKQILASERILPWQVNDPNYFSIDAPPSFKPAKKYSDISGLPANYTDPQSKLRFSTTEEFAYIRMLPSDIVTGYLTLRKAASVVP